MVHKYHKPVSEQKAEKQQTWLILEEKRRKKLSLPFLRGPEPGLSLCVCVCESLRDAEPEIRALLGPQAEDVMCRGRLTGFTVTQLN